MRTWMAWMTLVLLAVPLPSPAGERRLEGIGSVGGGMFLPTGSDADASHTGPALHLNAAAGFGPHLGADAQLLWVPLQMKTAAYFPVNPDSFHIDASQFTVLGGLRLASGHLIDAQSPIVAYSGLRIGFARLRVSASERLGGEGWISRDRNIAGFALGSTTDIAFVLSPKAGLLFRMGGRTALDLAFQPLFIYDQGRVNTQLYVTLSLAMSAWQTF